MSWKLRGQIIKISKHSDGRKKEMRKGRKEGKKEGGQIKGRWKMWGRKEEWMRNREIRKSNSENNVISP